MYGRHGDSISARVAARGLDGGRPLLSGDAATSSMANAFRAESPMLLIGGNSALKQYRMGGLQNCVTPR